MEHRLKRQRVSEGGAGYPGNLNSGALPAIETTGALEQVQSHSEDAVISSSPDATPMHGSSNPDPTPSRPKQPLARPGITPAPEQIYKRDLIPVIETVITSVIDVVLEHGSSKIAEITLDGAPGLPAVVTFPSIGPITVAALPTALPDIPPSLSVEPSNTLPSPSMSIEIPGASSQFVISSPPPTPLPSDMPFISNTDVFSASLSTINDFNTSTPTFTSTGSGNTSTGSTATGNTITGSTVTGSTVTASSTFSTGFFAGNSTITGVPSNSSTIAFQSGSSSRTRATDASQSSTSMRSGTSSLFPSSTGLGGSGVWPGPGNPAGTAATGPDASSTAAAGSGLGSNQSTATPAVVGGVVGGVAGLTIILVFLLFILRWRRRKMLDRQLRNGDFETAPPGTAQSMAGMTHSAAPFAETGLVPFFRKLRPHSGQTTATNDTASTERGFQNLGGRKIESVLVSGGDGYGGPGRSSVGNASSSSFYRDSQGTWGGPGSHPSSVFVGPGSPPMSPPMSPLKSHPIAGEFGAYPDARASDKEVAVMRPGPNRVPVQSPGFSPAAAPSSTATAPNVPPPPVIRPDAIGRSHPSLDGSRGSKFAENLP